MKNTSNINSHVNEIKKREKILFENRDELHKNLIKFIKNPGKFYVELFYYLVDKIEEYFKNKYKDKYAEKPRINIKLFSISPYYDERKNEISIPLYNPLDIFLITLPPIYILYRIHYFLSLPAIYAHERSHSMRNGSYSLSDKPPTFFNQFLTAFFYFLDKKMQKEEEIACREALNAVTYASSLLTKLLPSYSLNEATLFRLI